MKKTVKTIEVEKKVVNVTLNKDEFLECGADALARMLTKLDPPKTIEKVLIELFGIIIAKMACDLFDTDDEDDKED